jgi:hypothetical protein
MSKKGKKGEPFPTSARAPRLRGHYVKKQFFNQYKCLKRGHVNITVNQGNTLLDSQRRIVEIPFLSSQLVCKKCGNDLSLSNQVEKEERQRGLASILKIKCMHCKFVKSVYTCKKSSQDGLHDVNKKVALGKCMVNVHTIYRLGTTFRPNNVHKIFLPGYVIMIPYNFLDFICLFFAIVLYVSLAVV